MIARTKNLLMTPACFFEAYRDGHSSHMFEYIQFDCDQGGFIVQLPTGNSAGLDIVGQYEVSCKAGFDPVLTILALRRSSRVDCGSYANVEHPFFDYNVVIGEVSRFEPSRVAKCQRSVSKELVSVSGHDVLQLPGLVYVLMESCHADWQAAIGEIADVPVAVVVPSINAPEMVHLPQLLEKEAGWTQDVGSVDPHFVET